MNGQEKPRGWSRVQGERYPQRLLRRIDERTPPEELARILEEEIHQFPPRNSEINALKREIRRIVWRLHEIGRKLRYHEYWGFGTPLEDIGNRYKREYQMLCLAWETIMNESGKVESECSAWQE